jgi:isoleucyl-tRNA synthetase
MDALDRWALHQTAGLIDECTKAYDAYEFHRVYQLCNQFCSVTLSAVYHDILKDRLYTLGAAHPLRRSSQTALHHIFSALARILAPVITFTADEAWSYATTGREYADDSVHLQDWPVVPADWRNGALEAEIGALLKVRALVNERIEPARQTGTIGKSLDCAVTLEVPAGDALAEPLQRHRDFLPELFIVSGVGITTANGPLNAVIKPCTELGYHRCPRCWRWVPALATNATDSVCPRCVSALAG